MLVGVYGGIASGKNVLFRVMERHGFTCFDCDQISNALFTNCRDGWGLSMKEELTEKFGRLYGEKDIDSSKVKQLFQDDFDTMKEFCDVVISYTARAVEEKITAFWKNGGIMAATDAYQSLRGAFHMEADANVAVHAPDIYRIIWLRRREGCSIREAERRVQALTCLASSGAYILENDGSLEDFERKCETFLAQRERAGWSSRAGSGELGYSELQAAVRTV